jgi:SAM-dependent methyltransferase
MAAQSSRPFYGEYAWAFDLLIDRPVRKECGAITNWLIERGVAPGARLLDAGCGTGRYAAELARRGYTVEGVDGSSELIETARQSVRGHGHSVSFRVGDLLDLPVARYDGILCRGVLNDFVDDDARRSVFPAFAGALRRTGILILDVREWEATRDRKQREPLFRKSVETDRGKLTFTSTTELDPERHQLLLSETHTLANDAGERSERLSVRDAVLDEKRARFGSPGRRLWFRCVLRRLRSRDSRRSDGSTRGRRSVVRLATVTMPSTSTR